MFFIHLLVDGLEVPKLLHPVTMMNRLEFSFLFAATFVHTSNPNIYWTEDLIERQISPDRDTVELVILMLEPFDG